VPKAHSPWGKIVRINYLLFLSKSENVVATRRVDIVNQCSRMIDSLVGGIYISIMFMHTNIISITFLCRLLTVILANMLSITRGHYLKKEKN